MSGDKRTGLPNAEPWGKVGRELREAEKGLALSVLRTISTAVLAVMERRWRVAATLLRMAADFCDALGRVEVEVDLEAEAAKVRSLRALQKDRDA
jgi:hypothetical protein